jgi:hypothetical protein
MQRRLPPTGRRLSARVALPVVLVAAGFLACSDFSPTSTDLEPAFAPGGGGPPVRVTSTNPTEAEQGTTLTVRVLGSNFEPGAIAEFKRDGVPPGKVRTNSTTFVSPDELLADITVEVDADLGLYDVEVRTPRGKKGVGTELFRVLEVGTTSSARSGQFILTNWDSNSKVWSDGPIDARVTGDGRLYFETAKGKKARELCVDLSEHVTILDQPSYDLFVEQVDNDPTSAGLAAACTSMQMYTRESSHPGEVANQPVGSVHHAGGRIRLDDFATGGNRGSWWSLFWDVELDLVNDPQRSKGICVSRPDPSTWILYNDDDLATDPPSSCAAQGEAIDNVARLVRFADGLAIPVAEFLFPFRFQLIEQ